MKIGILVNPAAGLGGPRALKGSDADGARLLREGVEPTTPHRAARFIECLADFPIEWVTPSGCVGVPGLPRLAGPATTLVESSAETTKAAVKALIAHGVDLLVFVGGDGTARDVASVAGKQPCLGIPGGVKITSPVFAHTIEEAADIVCELPAKFATVIRDVTDLDEEAYRAGRGEVVLHGHMTCPVSPLIQGGKCPMPAETPIDGIVEDVMNRWPTGLVLVGAGSVCYAIKKNFWGEPTYLGIDAIDGKRIVETDLDRTRIEKLMETHEDITIMLTIIGGQGVAMGRGTQMIPPELVAKIGWDKIVIVSPPEKLLGLKAVTFDTGSAAVDASVPKFIRIKVGYNETRLMRTHNA